MTTQVRYPPEIKKTMINLWGAELLTTLVLWEDSPLMRSFPGIRAPHFTRSLGRDLLGTLVQFTYQNILSSNIQKISIIGLCYKYDLISIS